MNRCFVIGPIGDRFAAVGSPRRGVWEESMQVLEEVILPACAANDLEPIRADQIAIAGEITEQIFRHLYEDEVVIADVSGGNPNVMYELGLRHTRNLLTIQIGEYGQLPFDVQTVRTIEFSRSDRGLVDARNKLIESLKVGLAEGPDLLAPTRIWTAGSGGADLVVVEREDSEYPGEQTPVADDGIVDRIVSIEEAFPRMTLLAEQIGNVLTEIGRVAEGSSQEMDLLNARGASGRERLVSITKYARSLQPQADELGDLADTFVGEITSTDGDLSGLFAFFSDDENFEALSNSVEFLQALVSLAQAIRESMESMGQFGGSVVTLGKISKVLRRPGERMGNAVKVMVRAASMVDGWESSARRLMRKAGQSDAPVPAPTATPKPAEKRGKSAGTRGTSAGRPVA